MNTGKTLFSQLMALSPMHHLHAGRRSGTAAITGFERFPKQDRHHDRNFGKDRMVRHGVPRAHLLANTQPSRVLCAAANHTLRSVTLPTRLAVSCRFMKNLKTLWAPRKISVPRLDRLESG